MRADEAELANRMLERAHARHALRRIDAGERVEPVGVGVHHPGHGLVRQMPRALQAELADLAGDQEGALDTGLVHQRQHVRQGYPLQKIEPAADLADIERFAPFGPVGLQFGRHRVDDRIDGKNVRHRVSPPGFRRCRPRP